ncbi:MAG TPA: HAD-IC family P-type ATPase [Anaerolineae bacterium]
MEQQSNHPLALAVVRAVQAQGLALPPANGLENVAGRGVKSEVGGKPVLIGSLKLFRESGEHPLDGEVVRIVAQLENEGKTTMVVSQDGRFLGVLALADAPRPGVKATLQKLLDLGVQKLVMLTGDNADVAHNIGKEVGVTDVRAELLPQQKLEAIQQLQQEHGTIAIAGDGVNDAPALATATVGIAMGGAGTAVALETADVALNALRLLWYDKLSAIHDLLSFNDWPYRDVRKHAIKALHLQPGDTVIDLFCGTGVNFEPVLEQIGGRGRLIGIDGSAGMLARAQKRIQKAGWSAEQITLLKKDLLNLAPNFLSGILPQRVVPKVLITLALGVFPNYEEVFYQYFFGDAYRDTFCYPGGLL